MKAHSEWLGAQDLAGLGPVKIRIKQVLYFEPGSELAGRRVQVGFYAIDHEIPDGDGWKDAPKHWKLNVTNTRTLWARYGADVEQWAGKVITLRLEPTKSPQGGPPVHGVRIAPTAEERDFDKMSAHMRQLEQDPRSDEEVGEADVDTDDQQASDN